jgi:hypothetical protein
MRKRAPDRVLINVAKLRELLKERTAIREPDKYVDKLMSEILSTCKQPHANRFLLENVYGSDGYVSHILGSVDIDTGGITFGFSGYGENGAREGHGQPVLIENREGELYVVVWADINREDPTHSICMSGAKESNRKAE